jgi:hypothetical protein
MVAKCKQRLSTVSGTFDTGRRLDMPLLSRRPLR